MPSVLIIMPDPELVETIGKCIRAVFDQPDKDVTIHGAGSAAEARQRMAARDSVGYDLLVCHIHIPEDETTRDYTSKTYGLKLLQTLNRDGCHIPAILIAHDAGVFNEIQKMAQVKLVIDGTETMEDELIQWCRTFLPQSPGSSDPDPDPMPELKLGRVDLILSRNRAEYKMEGTGIEFHDARGILKIDTLEIDDLIHRSRKMLKDEEWKEELRWIGRKILKQIFKNNKEFSDAFKALSAAVVDEKQLWIRFVVKEDIYPLALEAIVDDNKNHLMLLLPLSRTVTISESFWPESPFLFRDHGEDRPPVNCLIIAAETFGEAEIPQDGTIILNPIPKVMAEAEKLFTYFNENSARFNIAKVGMVTPDQDGRFNEPLKALLHEGTSWDLIHYAGHTYFDPRSKKGYFFFPSETGPKSVPSDLFSQQLRFHNKTQFIYLSSCESAGTDFVLGLARQMIPSIIGFRWEIEDDKAADYADQFYKKLFEENRSLPLAFLETRQAMYERYYDNRIWAAAMLIIQGR